MEGKIDMAARRQVTNKLRSSYQRAGKTDKGRILDEVMAATGLARSSGSRLLSGGELPAPADQVDGRRLRVREYSDAARCLLEHVWKLMGLPCGKYFVAMWPIWFPSLAEAGELAGWPDYVLDEISRMSAATVDRYLAPAKAGLCIKGISTTKPAAAALRNSIGVRRVGDELDGLPGNIEGDTVARCGPTRIGEFARTLTLTDIATGWTECQSVRNNASKWVLQGIIELREKFPFEVRNFDSDNGSEFINHRVANWLQQQDIDQTRSRPYQKNDQATVESKNNHVVRKHGFYWRYDTAAELALLNELWIVVGLRLNYFTPTKKPIGYTQTASGRRKRVYDSPATPWKRAVESGLVPLEKQKRLKQCWQKPTQPT